MGSGAWSATNYFDRAKAKAEAGRDTFAHSADVKKSGKLRVHQTLDPYGLGMRESRDNAEHPDSNPIIISLDVTGSMDRVVRGIHRDLPHLHELLLGQKYIPHPQILFAAVGDATCDQIPLQVGQFESDNRMDQNLENMVLEGGGGAQNTESYELMMYLAARNTVSDAWEKRRRKGYLFLIGDEMAYPRVSRAHIHKLDPQADIPLEQVIAEATERYHVFFIIPGGAAHGGDKSILDFWQQKLGPSHVLKLQNPEDTSECIAMTIGATEGVITLEQATQQLKQRGRIGGAIDRLLSAISGLFGSRTPTDSVSGTRRL